MSDPNAEVRYRLRVAYGKDERLAYLGHLEVLATIERSVRRACLPFSVSQGFAKHMRLQFTQALPTGASSCCEFYDVQLLERVGESEAYEALRASTPPDLCPTRVGYVDRQLPALEAWLTRSRWEVNINGCEVDPQAFLSAVDEIRMAGKLHFMRGDKPRTVDVPSTLVSIDARESQDGLTIVMDTRATGAGALRPGVLIAHVCEKYPDILPFGYALKVRRVGQWHEDDGRLVEAL